MTLSDFLKCTVGKSVRLMDSEIDLSYYIPIDLSDSNLALESVDFETSKSFSSFINHFLKSHSKTIAYGGYMEKRLIYNRSIHFQNESLEQQRNIHLGLDLWCTEKTPVLAAFDGMVHSFKNNTAFGDYGPTLILEHHLQDFVFFTLYGHLSLDSIATLYTGQKIQAGAIVGRLGGPKVNGDYPPHLHFQIIEDLQGNFGDYPGVCNANEVEFYKDNCPDPNFILKLQ